MNEKENSVGKETNPKEPDIKQVVMSRMASAQAHQGASEYLSNMPAATPSNLYSVLFFPVVSFELLTLSVEQSLRLLLLLHIEGWVDRNNHNLMKLYNQVRAERGKLQGLHDDIICKMNAIGKSRGYSVFSESELTSCLKKHHSSYSDFRYFQVDRQGKVSLTLELLPREIQIMDCLASALIEINMREVSKQGMKVWGSVSHVPWPEAPEEVRRKLKPK